MVDSVWAVQEKEAKIEKNAAPELPETRLAKVRYFAGIASEATIVADEEQCWRIETIAWGDYW